MERQQDREPLGAQQPIPLVQILPDGRLAYVNLAVAPMGIAPPQPLAAHTSAQDLTGKRDRWALIVKIAGALMLIGGVIGLVARACTVGENRGHRWAFWGVALGVDLLMILTGILGLKAGRQKTSMAARRYKRFLIFFAIVYVLVTGAATICFAKHEFKHLKQHHNGGGYRYNTEGTRDMPPPMDYIDGWPESMEQDSTMIPGGEETRGRPDREGRTIPPYTPSEGEDGWESGNASSPAEMPTEESEILKHPRNHPKRHDRPEGENQPEEGHRRPHDRDEHRRPPHDSDNFPEAPRDLPTTSAEFPPTTASETTTAVMPTEPAFLGEEENQVEDASLQGRNKKEKKEKKEDGRDGYGHKDEMPKWSKKDLKRGMIVGMGVAMLLTVGLCSCCVFCACRLVKYSESYEALFPRQSPAPQYSFYYPQPAPYAYQQVPQPSQAPQASPAQAYQQVPQGPPAQVYQQVPQAQAYQQMPQVVQAVPVNHANLYPNLAPMGVSFPPRAS